MTEVVAALFCQDDRFLICQRPAHKKRGLLWEFVGGKREGGESKEEALVRECQEELGITIRVGGIFMELTHVYPDITIALTLFRATISQGSPQLLEHEDFRWIKVEEIPKFAFCLADEEILRHLTEVGLPWDNESHRINKEL
jgi:8-oxo-dGTP diphosphatase